MEQEIFGQLGDMVFVNKIHNLEGDAVFMKCGLRRFTENRTFCGRNVSFPDDDEREFNRELSIKMINQALQRMGMILISKTVQSQQWTIFKETGKTDWCWKQQNHP